MRASFYLRQMARESRGSRGRLAFFVACLAVGVAAVVAVAGIAESLDRGVRSTARQLLAADLTVSGRRPLPAELDRLLSGWPGAARTDVKELGSVVSAAGNAESPGKSVLAELKAVGDAYPLYGALELDPPRGLHELLGPDRTVVAAELLHRLDLKVGDALRIGGREFIIHGTVVSEPDKIKLGFSLGPRVFLSMEGLARADLERFGSRILYRALIRLPPGSSAEQARNTAETIRTGLPDADWIRVETYAEPQPGFRRGVRQVERYLGLVALLSLLIGGVGVAQVVKAWLAGRMDAIAILKCLGLRFSELFVLYVGQTAILGLAGSLVGVIAGIGVQYLLPFILGAPPPVEVQAWWQPWAALRGLALGTAVALLFALQPLMAIRRVSPARVLRRDADPLPVRRWIGATTWAVILGGILLTASIQARSLLLGVLFTVGIVAVVVTLGGAALVLSRLVSRLDTRRAGVWLRHGLAALHRPGASSLSAIVALGVGVLVVLSMYLVQDRLSDQLRSELPRDAPTAFLVDIQLTQWPDLRELLVAQGAARIDSVAMIASRLQAVDGRPVETLLADEEQENPQRRWVLTREQRLTYLDRLPADNTIVAGKLWADPDHDEISVEQRFARDLGVDLGSVLTLDIQGVPLDLRVTSLRSVEWDRFGINFFLVVEPGVLEQAPQSRVATVRLPAGTEQHVQDLIAASFPNVTMINIRDILNRVVTLAERLHVGVRFLGSFTVLAGIAILAGAVGAGSVRRGREVALLKALGMTRRGVLAMFSVEYAAIGFVAGTIGTLAAGVLSWAVLTHGIKVGFELRVAPYLLATIGSVLLTVAAGTAASARALARRPIEVLREE